MSNTKDKLKAMKAERNMWKDISRNLFVILDDIDTADDLAKGNEKLYRNLVRLHHKKRFDFQSLIDKNGDVSEFNQPPTPPEKETP